ncbi:MAG TPA: DNA mismatch repair protein Vsr [Opitutae bacterium]|nr:DNA mismatch repair protein Vsr [Opitutaceae bacterium]HCR30569.1 DNA mismatch repair protein Vsr [Opitutae bacterium]|tara:strand:+ start:1183 stop:1677 length:495 start_codon:yes stop_codon:yes gene_type:complete
MPDKISKLHRSWVMSRVGSRNTKPELIARSLLHNLGYRFTVNGPHNKKLPGKPDIVLPKYRTVVFVHGCFWHRHPNCKIATTPKSNQDYWLPKFRKNVERDRRNQTALQKAGWNVLVIWECELKDLEAVAARLINELPRETKYELPEEIESHRLVAEQKNAFGL